MPKSDEELYQEPNLKPDELFINKIMDEIHYFAAEFDMSYSTFLGCFDIIHHELLTDISETHRHKTDHLYDEDEEDQDENYFLPPAV